MGSAASALKPPTMGEWTPDEIAENDRVKAMHETTSKWLAIHLFYSYPVRCQKQSEDPLSPMWFVKNDYFHYLR